MDSAVETRNPTPLVPATPGLAARWRALPGRTQVYAGLGVAALLAVLVALAGNVREGDYRPLFPELSDKDGGLVDDRLTQMQVPHRVNERGLILVPANRVHELRMKLAAAGLPGSRSTGYELLDKGNTFGQTQGQERTKLQRAIEGELATSIQALDSVRSARVHLGLPNQNGFFREQHKPTASVVLTLHPGRTLDREQIAGIVHIVSSSVPELATRAVSVVDSSGALLSGPSDAEGGGAHALDSRQLQYRREVEAGHQKRVMALLEPVFGRDNVRASVSAEIDFAQVERTSEAFGPNQGSDAKAAIREQRSEESNQPGAGTASGVPGAASNQPQAAASAPINGPAQALQAAQGGTAGAVGRREAATRFEVDRTVTVTRNATGTVRRISAAVVVNHRTGTDAKGKPTSTPLSDKEIEQLTALVQQGIGYSADRGDVVRVVNAPFKVEATVPGEELPLWKQPWLVDLLRSSAAPAALALVGLVVVFSLIRPALIAVLAPPPPPPGAKLDEVVDDDDAAAPAPAAPPVRLGAPQANERLDAVRNLARENPAAVAQIVRGWVSGEPA